MKIFDTQKFLKIRSEMKQFMHLIVAISVLITFSQALPCKLKMANESYVCVCSSTYCDTLDFTLPVKNQKIAILSTSKGGIRFNQTTLNVSTSRYKIEDYNKSNCIINQILTGSNYFFNPTNTITINRNRKFQKIVGFGGAFTGSISDNLQKLPTPLVHSIYKSYYSMSEGIGYNLMRLTIGGCDFDLGPWGYNENPINDVNLSNFTQLDARDFTKINQIKTLMNVSNNANIKLKAAAWSPPPWMKTGNSWTGYATLLPQYYQTWANYHVKFAELMKANGLPLWAVSTGNEPEVALFISFIVKYMSLGWYAADQAKWIVENLGPTIARSSTVSDLKIIAGETMRINFDRFISTLYANKSAIDSYIYGHAYHWYGNKFSSPSILDTVYNKYPNKPIFMTEASTGALPWETRGPVLGSWQRSEDYIFDIIDNLNHYVSGWIDWNLILNNIGGPSYVQNYIDAAMIINSTYNEVYKQPMFYALGHFSRFITRDSYRVYSMSDSDDIKAVAATRPDGYTVVVVYNKKDVEVNIDINDETGSVVKLNIPPKSIHTIVY